MRSLVRSVTGESYATRPGFQGPTAVRETPQNPRGSGVFSTRPCPCLRTERFEGTVGRQPEQITLPFGQRPASPGLVALRRATVETIARHRTVPHPVLLRAVFVVILTLSLGFTAIFRFFRKNFNGRYFRFAFSQFLYHGNSISSYSFQDIEMRFAAFDAQLNWLQNTGSRFLNFCPQNFLEPSKVKIFFQNFFFDFGGL